ncbi:hypothetical protein C2845_PM04G07540 [Panicum miliaceum]|uniref:TF-B3 domain-containing protein n=1 Tax=Panicum miliaceum TaxID=4540 RepID=A0A3L6QKC0_PANMI|nr:hypothetical protein C2845_PM04G07540 [Panicum miliaceum]
MEPGSGGSSRCRAAEGESQDKQGDASVEVELDLFPGPAPRPLRVQESAPRRPSLYSSWGSGITFSAGSQSSKKGGGGSKSRGDRAPPATAVGKEHLFDKVLTPADVGKRLVIPEEDAVWPFMPGVVFTFEDPNGKQWSFRCSYSKELRGCYMTKEWSRFVRKKGLHAGDTVSFYRGLGAAGHGRFFVDWKLHADDAHRRRLRLPKQPPMATPNLELADPCSASSIRRLSAACSCSNHHTISPSSGAQVSFAWLTKVRSLTADAEDCLQDLHCRMMQAVLGVGNHEKVRIRSNVSGNSSKTTSSSFFQSASPVELTVISIDGKLEGLEHGRPELSVAAPHNSTGAEAKADREVPAFVSDDLTYTGRAKKPAVFGSLKLQQPCTGMLQNLQILVLSNCQKLQNLPVSLCDLSKLRLLDLSGCSRLETLPYSFVTLRQMEILNLSYCKRLKELPQPFGILQGLKYLNLSGCHGLDLDVECKLANLMCVTMSPHRNIQGFSKSFQDLKNHLDMSRWWKKSWVHPHCNPKDDLYVKYRFLRALNLSSTDILQLPNSIGNMKHLRFLALNNTKIKALPFEIGQVDTLQTLELKDCCHLTELPGSTSNLTKLRHLDVRKEPSNFRVSMPHGIGQLTNLQTLTVFNIGNDSLHCSIVELKNLSGLLGHVHITGLENIKTADDAREANIVGKHFLEALTLEWSYSNGDMDDELGEVIANDILQNLQPNSNIMELVVRNYAGNKFPAWMQDSYLCNLVSVTLDNCHECSELPYLGDLPCLKSLFIQRMNSIESFGIESNSLAIEENHPLRFPSLEVLTLWEMYDLRFWVGISEGDFPRICHLSISRCPKLTKLPPLLSLVHLSIHCGGQVPSFSELPSLESLKIEGFNKIRSISFPHQLTTLKKLEISDCKELSSMYAYSLSVSDLRVVRCPKLDLVGSSLEDHHRQKVDGGR